MMLDTIANFLELAMRSLRTSDLQPDPLAATVQDAAKIAVLSQAGLAGRLFSEIDEENAEPDEIQDLIDGLPDMPVLDELDRLDERFNPFEGNSGPIDLITIQKAVRLVDEGVETFTAAWKITGKQYAMDEEKWREEAGATELDDAKNYLFLDDLQHFELDNVAFAISSALQDAAIKHDRELVNEIAAALESSETAFFAFRSEDLVKSIKLARRALIVRDKFTDELMSGLEEGGVKLSQFLDGYAEIRDIAQFWINDMIGRKEVEVVKKGGRKMLVRPID